jgi:serine/threonine protein kinase
MRVSGGWRLFAISLELDAIRSLAGQLSSGLIFGSWSRSGHRTAQAALLHRRCSQRCRRNDGSPRSRRVRCAETVWSILAPSRPDVTNVPADPEFLGHYRVVRKLGSGGMGDVYLAHDSTLERPVAIKLIAGSQTDTEGGRRRLLREAQAAAALDHPNICAVHEIRSEGGRSFIVMQFCDGETLAARLQRGPIPPDETTALLMQVADALAFAHRAGLVHRDVKPQNIIISPRGRVKVLDFGLAKLARPDGRPPEDTRTDMQLTLEGSPVGTASYMAPEQIRCAPVDTRADLFAVGVVMYECLTGRRPFEGRSTYEFSTRS